MHLGKNVSTSERSRIGRFIVQLREERGITQKELARALHTSQSAVSRMEEGRQNFTTEMLSKISRALNREIVTLASGAMNFRIEGGRNLSGKVVTNTSKNSAVALLCASLLNRGRTVLKNMPRIEEVHRVIEVLSSIGTGVRWVGDDVHILPPKRFKMGNLNVESAVKTRSVLLLLGPLVHHVKRFSLPHPGGCKLGRRTVRPHLFALEKLGVRIETTKTSYNVSIKKLKAADVVLYETGDTTTENALVAAALIPGKTVIKFASANYQVQDVCFFLQALGIQIEGIGTSTLTVYGLPAGRYGVPEIDTAVEYSPSEDPIESMLFLSIAATTKSSIYIERR